MVLCYNCKWRPKNLGWRQREYEAANKASYLCVTRQRDKRSLILFKILDEAESDFRAKKGRTDRQDRLVPAIQL